MIRFTVLYQQLFLSVVVRALEQMASAFACVALGVSGSLV